MAKDNLNGRKSKIYSFARCSFDVPCVGRLNDEIAGKETDNSRGNWSIDLTKDDIQRNVSRGYENSRFKSCFGKITQETTTEQQPLLSCLENNQTGLTTYQLSDADIS